MVTVYVAANNLFCLKCKSAKIAYSQAVRNTVCEYRKIGGCGKMERFRAGENVLTL
jgi:hypothetical protein